MFFDQRSFYRSSGVTVMEECVQLMSAPLIHVLTDFSYCHRPRLLYGIPLKKVTSDIPVPET